MENTGGGYETVKEEAFNKRLTNNFQVSLIDNRVVYFQLFDVKHGNNAEYTITFSNVHKKH